MSDMQPRKPYMLRSTYEWIADSSCTPYIVVDAGIQHVQVPLGYVQEGQIVLNASMTAVQNLEMTNEAVSFSARFAGRVEHIYVPINAVLAIYAKENGEGLFFTIGSAEDDADDSDDAQGGVVGASDVAIPAQSSRADKSKTKAPSMKLVSDGSTKDAAKDKSSKQDKPSPQAKSDLDAVDDDKAGTDEAPNTESAEADSGDSDANSNNKQATKSKQRPTLTIVK